MLRLIHRYAALIDDNERHRVACGRPIRFPSHPQAHRRSRAAALNPSPDAPCGTGPPPGGHRPASSQISVQTGERTCAILPVSMTLGSSLYGHTGEPGTILNLYRLSLHDRPPAIVSPRTATLFVLHPSSGMVPERRPVSRSSASSRRIRGGDRLQGQRSCYTFCFGGVKWGQLCFDLLFF
jgi:hypothetical protein